jgi:hypothetical protein
MILANVGDLGSLGECGADDDSSFKMFGFGKSLDVSPDDMRDGCMSGEDDLRGNSLPDTGLLLSPLLLPYDDPAFSLTGDSRVTDGL